MYKKLIKFGSFGFLLLLTNCFEIVEEVSFNRDGSGHVTLSLNLSRSKTKLNSILRLDSINNYEVPSEIDIRKHFTEITSTVENTKGISNVTNSLNFNEYIFSISCDFNDVDALNTVISNFSTKEEALLIKKQKHFSFDKTQNTFTRNYHYDISRAFQKTRMEDRKVFETASITTIYRFETPILSSKNSTAKIAPSKKAIMLRVNAQELITNQNSMKNQIKLQN
jgi:hypothetical protein